MEFNSATNEAHTARRVLIVGLGNLLRGDEGVGVHAARRLSGHWQDREGPVVLDGGTLGLSLIEPMADASALALVDAVDLRAEPGRISVFVGAGMDRFLGGLKTRTAHDVNLVDLVHALRLLDGLPRFRALIAIQPGSLEWGVELSEEVDAALTRLPVLCERLLACLRRRREREHRCAARV